MKKSHIIHNSAKNVEKFYKMVYNEFRIVVVNMKRLIKIIYIILIVLTLTMFIQITSSNVYAENIINTDDYEPEIEDTTDLFDKAGIVVAVIRNIGIVVSVIALMLIGIRAMVGSASEKADYQKSLPGYLVGAVLVFAITMIPSMIYNMLK